MCKVKACGILWCFMYFMTGLGLMGTGVWLAVDDDIYERDVMKDTRLVTKKSTKWKALLGYQLALGAYLILVGILGMAGSACDMESKVKNSLIAFAVFAAIGKLATLVYSGFVTHEYVRAHKSNFNGYLHQGHILLYKPYADGGADKFTGIWNTFQTENKCCGVDTYLEYVLADGLDGRPVPWSCCRLKENTDNPTGDDDVLSLSNCHREARGSILANTTELYTNGCADIHWKKSKRDRVVFMSMGWVSFFVQIVAVGVVSCVRKQASD